jgi:hypothetical protein
MTLSVAACGAVQATEIASGTVQVSATDPLQLGRLSRDGVPSYWGDITPASTINNATSYHYKTIDLNLDALEAGYDFGSFFQITFDSTSTTTFLSAYLDTYTPANILANWLGDPGTSGNYFGPDAITFQVTAQAGHHLVLVMNETTPNGGLNMPGNYLVEAFSDTEYTDLAVAAVPEPATWGLLIGGLGLVGVAGKRRAARRHAETVTAA